MSARSVLWCSEEATLPGRLADELPEAAAFGDEASGEDVVLGEAGHQDLARAEPVMVVDDVDVAALVLRAVGVRDRNPLVEHQPPRPSPPVVI